jgi:hypothetical protein
MFGSDNFTASRIRYHKFDEPTPLGSRSSASETLRDLEGNHGWITAHHFNEAYIGPFFHAYQPENFRNRFTATSDSG